MPRARPTSTPGPTRRYFGRLQRETRVGVVITASVVIVVAIAGLITPGSRSDASRAPKVGATTPATNAFGAPVAAPVPYGCRPNDAPQLTSLHGHQHATGFDVAAIAVLSSSVCSTLGHELALAATVATRVPTLADARRLGYKPVGFYAPGLGLHMETPRGIDKKFDPADPEYLLYGGDLPTSTIVGYAYAVVDPGGVPQLFAGGHDVPHSHGYCKALPGTTASRAPGDPGCTRENAVDGSTWLVHTWAVPGKPSPWGVFSDANPALTPKGYDAAHPVTAHQLDCYYDTKAGEVVYKGC